MPFLTKTSLQFGIKESESHLITFRRYFANMVVTLFSNPLIDILISYTLVMAHCPEYTFSRPIVLVPSFSMKYFVCFHLLPDDGHFSSMWEAEIFAVSARDLERLWRHAFSFEDLYQCRSFSHCRSNIMYLFNIHNCTWDIGRWTNFNMTCKIQLHRIFINQLYNGERTKSLCSKLIKFSRFQINILSQSCFDA